MNLNVIRTITIKGQSQDLDKVSGEVRKLAGEMQNVAVVSDRSAKGVLSLEDAWKKQTLKLDEAARAQANIARETSIADRAQREGLITQQQHAERLGLIGQRYAVATVQAGKFAGQTGLNRYELLNLSRQMQDVGVSLAGGQSPFVVLTQQGSQILDVFQATNGTVRGFFSQAIGWAGRFVASTAGVVTGVGAIAAGALYAAGAWQESQRDIEKALIGIGRRSGVTANDINQIARTASSATGLTIGEAREAATEFAKTGAIYKDNIQAASLVTKNFAIVTGQDAKEAAQSLGAALADPAKGADELNNKLGFLDGKTRELVITLANQNRVQEAQKILLDGVAGSVAKATDTLGPFEKAWLAVGKAASSVKNTVGAALSPNTEQENLAALTARRDQLQSGSGIGLFNQRGNQGEIARLNAEIEKLQANLAKAAAAAADDRFKQFSIEADNAVRALQPQIAQLQAVEKALADIKRAQTDANVGGKQGLGSLNDPATRAGQAASINLQESAAQADRLNQITLNIASNYRDVGVETAKVLINLEGAREVAAAVTGAEQLRAQEVARTVQLYLEGKTIIEASAIASAERAVSEAAINAQVENQVHALEQSTELIKARQKGTEATVKAEQAYENAIRAGADASVANDLRLATLANERARLNERIAAAAERTAQAAAEAQRRWEAAARALKFIPFYLLDTLGLMDKLFDSKQGGKSQFNPEGYKSTSTTFDMGSYADQINRLLSTGKSTGDAFNQLLSGGLTKSPDISGGINSGKTGSSSSLGGPLGLDTEKLAALDRLIATMSEDQQKIAIASEIRALQSMGGSLERDEAIKRLTDSLAQLTDATKDNTSATAAMTDVLSPFYSSDPRRTHLGFRAFAGGGIMTSHGMLPLKQYDGGGIANSPQVSVFGEGSSPEAYVPVPTGRIPVTINQPANSNNKQAPQIKIEQHFHGPVTREMASLVKKSGFQAAQDARRVIGG